jgi:chromosomal replication initiator protein
MRAQVGRGFVAELELPDALVRRHILHAKAAGGGVRLPSECLDLLVESTAGSVRDVESMLIQVVTTSSLLGRKIDLDLVREAIALKAGDSGAIDSKTLATEEIVRIVASFFGKPAEALAGRSRRRDVLIPRQLAMYLAHRYTDASFTEIGRCLGRDHPSVRNAITRIERLVLENAPLRYQVESLSERIDRAVNEKDPAK